MHYLNLMLLMINLARVPLLFCRNLKKNPILNGEETVQIACDHGIPVFPSGTGSQADPVADPAGGISQGDPVTASSGSRSQARGGTTPSSAPPASTVSPSTPAPASVDAPREGDITESQMDPAGTGGFSTPPLGSSAPTSSTPTEAAFEPSPSSSAQAQRPRTRSQHGIVRPKQYTDGTIRYGNLCSIGEPQTLQEALSDTNWKRAMEEEYAALLRNGTWHLVPAKPGMNLIDCKWMFKIKRKADGTIDRYKGRLVAKGYKQQYGIDYEDHF